MRIAIYQKLIGGINDSIQQSAPDFAKFEGRYNRIMRNYANTFKGTIPFLTADLKAEDILNRMLADRTIVKGSMLVETDLGDIDISRLNDINNYNSPAGHIDMARDIEILLNINNDSGKWKKSALSQLNQKSFKQKSISTSHAKASFAREHLKENLVNIDGYIKFADDCCGGNMKSAFQLASAIKGLPWIQNQNWGTQIVCKTTELPKLEAALSDDLINIEGYKKFANDHFEGNMQKAFGVASAIKGLPWIQKQNWGIVLRCKTTELTILKRALSDDLANLDGYIKFADENCDGYMDKAFKLASAIKGLSWIQKQNWGTNLRCKTTELPKLEAALSDDLINIEGYKKFANDHFAGNMQQAFEVASAIKGLPWIQKQNWGIMLKCKTTELSKLEKALSIDLKNIEGYKKFADENCDGYMQKAFQIASALKGLSWIQKQNWGAALQCKTAELAKLEKALSIDLINLEGYKKFANDHCGGDMLKAFQTASAIKGLPWIQKQNWGIKLQCKTTELPTLEKALSIDLKNLEGYKKFADDHCGGNMKKAFELASAIKGLPWIQKQSWGASLSCKTTEIAILEKALSDDLINIDGYKKFADDHCAGDMKKAFELASAIKGLPWIQKQNWGSELICKTTELSILEKALTDDLINIEGYKKFADDYSAGDMFKAFKLASAIKGLPWIQEQNWGIQLNIKTWEL